MDFGPKTLSMSAPFKACEACRVAGRWLPDTRGKAARLSFLANTHQPLSGHLQARPDVVACLQLSYICFHLNRVRKAMVLRAAASGQST